MLTAVLCALLASDPPVRAELVRVERIWNAAPHNAFTDLVRWKGAFYCAFREGKGHAGDIGELRVITSRRGRAWRSVALLALAGYDLRDAALSATPDGRLMVLGGAQRTVDGVRRTGTFVSFSKDGAAFTVPRMVVDPGRWLWRVTWHEGKAWGVAYATPDGRPHSSLLVSEDGERFTPHVPRLLGAGGLPTEARVRFDGRGRAFCLHRRDGRGGNTAFLGRAERPYDKWEWHDTGRRIGGPNFMRLPSGHWIGAGRLYDGGARTELLWIDTERMKVTPILRLPSGGDTSYPGMVWHEGRLFVSYYSSHEGRTSVYLAEVRVTPRAAPLREVGGRRELFVDDWLIDRLDGAERRLHAPVAREKVLHVDKPWEGIYSGYFTVFRDDDRLRMYYRGMPEAKHDLDTEVTCYAESEDGLAWTKPELGLYEVRGTRANNVVLARHRACHNFAPFKDTSPACPPAERYKALGGTGRPGLIALVSPDGLRWKEKQKEPVLTKGAFDSQNVAFWSASEGCYVCYFRVFRSRVRWIARATSKDFVTWTDPVDLEVGDQPRQHLYTNQLAPYVRAPHVYLGTPTRFMPGRRVFSDARTKALGTARGFDFRNDCADIVLHSTRGGGPQFDRSFLEAFLRPGLDPRNWTSRASYAAHGIVVTGERELSLYVNQNVGYPSSHVRRYTMRPDGFVSVRAGFKGGTMTTKPLTFAGSRLNLNCSTSAAGRMRVEIRDAAGKPLPGFGLADCADIVGDDLDRTVTWKSGPSVKRLRGKPIRLHFELQDADLYSLQFVR